MARPKIFTEEEVIDRAIEVFRTKCYADATPNELLAAMGIGKGSFYLSFKGGKQELYERSMKRYAERLTSRLELEMDSSGDDLAYLKGQFIMMANSSDDTKEKGCYFGNALVSLSQEDRKNKLIAANYLESLRRIFKKGIQNAQARGNLSMEKDADILAWHLLNLWNGINVTRRIEKSPVTLSQLVEFSFMVFE
jgi:TetR/AcrR family transcriptional regulator, transcriptional repressor for nem operon